MSDLRLSVLTVGAGNMGGALLRRWADLDGVACAAVDPAASEIDGVSFFRGADELGDRTFDVVVLAVKPQMIASVAGDYVQRLAPDGAVASIAAGASIAQLQSIFGAVAIVRMMPNLPAQIGEGVSALCANAHADESVRANVERLARAAGDVVWVKDDDMIDRFTAIAGSGPGYVFEIAREYTRAAEALGFEAADARRMALAVMRGAVAMALQDERPLGAMRDAVTSRKGTTEAGLAELTRDGQLENLFDAALKAAYARARALAQEVADDADA